MNLSSKIGRSGEGHPSCCVCSGDLCDLQCCESLWVTNITWWVRHLCQECGTHSTCRVSEFSEIHYPQKVLKSESNVWFFFVFFLLLFFGCVCRLRIFDGIWNTFYLSYLSLKPVGLAIGHVTLVAIIGTTNEVPCHLVKSLNTLRPRQMDVISNTFSIAFSWMKLFEFRLTIFQLTIFQHKFR